MMVEKKERKKEVKMIEGRKGERKKKKVDLFGFFV